MNMSNITGDTGRKSNRFVILVRIQYPPGIPSIEVVPVILTPGMYLENHNPGTLAMTLHFSVLLTG